jgi:hypothetical protein
VQRLDGIDCIRGLMLVIILVDHIDALTTEKTFSRFTLLSLGYSDAADVFVWCSGFVFGYCYDRPKVRKVSRRVIQIYTAFVFTSACVYAIESLRLGLNWSVFFHRVASYCLLSNQSNNAGILCLYVVLLPWLAFLFWLRGYFHKSVIPMVSISVYAFAQYLFLCDVNWPRNWAFKPLTWQLLIVVAAIAGLHFQSASSLRRSKGLVGLAFVVVIGGVFLKLNEFVSPFRLSRPPAYWQYLTDKANWSLVRAIHHLSLVYLIYYLVPMDASCWTKKSCSLLRVCGQQPLTTFCVGILLVECARLTILYFGEAPTLKMFLVLYAVGVQFTIAWMLRHIGFYDFTHAAIRLKWIKCLYEK